MKREYLYEVSRMDQSFGMDADWTKPQWQNVTPVSIIHYMGTVPRFQPQVQVKMMYDPENLYVIFHVRDCCIRCITDKINGPVWEDSCVEFFFAPDVDNPGKYFNLEINCGGTPLMHFNTLPGNQSTILDPGDIGKIEIAHTQERITDPEIMKPVEWNVEYRIPIPMLQKYSLVTHPEPDVVWRANFCKIAENNSNPHYMTWSEVNNDVPDFHLPQFFGLLKFQ
jgi:hypothetical protein